MFNTARNARLVKMILCLFALRCDAIRSSSNHVYLTYQLPGCPLGMGDYGDDFTSMGPIDFMFISNYIVNFEFLLDEIPELLSLPRACIIYGAKEGSENAWRQASTSADGACTVDFVCRNPSDPPASAANPFSQRIPFGVHHSKLFLVGYNSGLLRVVVHTANLRYSDVNNKAQVRCSVPGF